MTNYLERASVARGLKALLAGAAKRGGAVVPAAIAESRSVPDAPDLSAAGTPVPHLSA